ncbi:MAG: sulfite exporter TauE/SafE family protein, partial [Chloroflexi bacterium]|nr:sulfite exporter TauE/SafE family protein [Chloroflexota bacterium]
LVPAYLGYLTGASAEGVGAAVAGPSGPLAVLRTGPGAMVAAASPPRVSAPSPFLHAASFVGGFSAVFIALGASVGLIGLLFSDQQFVLRDHQDLILKVAGGTLIVLGLHLSGVITIPFLEQERRLNVDVGDRVGYLRSFLVGSTFSAGWSPCIGPTLGVVLTLGAASATVWQGVILLAVYSLGLAVPFLAMGLGFNFVRPLYNRAKRYVGIVNYISGAMLIVVGILIFTNSLINLNSLFNFGFLGDISSEA